MDWDWDRTGQALRKWALPALLTGVVCVARWVPFGVDWPVLAMAALAVSSSGLTADMRSRGGSQRVQVALVHPVLFGCALTLGPLGAATPALLVGASRLISGRQSQSPLGRVLYDLAGPMAATLASSLTFVHLGGNLVMPQGTDSLAPLLWSGLAYASSGAILFGATRAERVSVAEGRSAAAVAAGWALSLLAGYVLAIIYAAAPIYATYVLALAGICAAFALGAPAPRQREVERRQVDRQATSAAEPIIAVDGPSFVDSATGLANRRYLDLFLDREVGRAQRLDKPLCIAVFNIDGFRHLDDGAAQTAMLELGKRLAAGIREYDIAARHSDGRVVLVLPEATLEAALEVVERLRTAASQAVVEGKPLVVSVGLAAFSKHGDSAEELINAAHHALNRGRSETSDRVHLPEDLAKAS